MASTRKGMDLAPDRASHPLAASPHGPAAAQGLARDPLSVRLAARAQLLDMIRSGEAHMSRADLRTILAEMVAELRADALTAGRLERYARTTE